MFAAEDMVLALFGSAAWCYTLSFCNGVMTFSRNSLPSAACHWSNCYDTSMLTHSCSSISSQGKQWQTFQYPKVFSYIALCPMPSCATVSLTITHWSSLMSASTHWSLRSVMAVLGWPVQGRLAMSLLPFLSVSPNAAHCWHPCRNLHRHGEINQRCWQQNCSPL
jgi:hypothetical protein